MVKDLINETYENRAKIEPNYSMAAELKALDIFKLLPGNKLQEMWGTDLSCLCG